MATAILKSIKHGAYVAISLYVVFIAVVTVTSMNPQLKSHTFQAERASLVELEHATAPIQERAS